MFGSPLRLARRHAARPRAVRRDTPPRVARGRSSHAATPEWSPHKPRPAEPGHIARSSFGTTPIARDPSPDTAVDLPEMRRLDLKTPD
jgi:hypothetical protein